MGKPKAPKAPDPQVTAGAQTAQNIGTAIAQQQLNNTNQITPYGNLTYEQSGSYEYTDPNTGQVHDIPTYTATQTLSRDQQAIHDQNERTSLSLARLGANQSRRLDGLLSRPMSLSDLPERGELNLDEVGSGPRLKTGFGSAGRVTKSYGGDYSKSRQRVEDAIMSRMQPGLDRDREALEARLASQGVRVGSEAYNAAMDDFSRQTNDARLGAVMAGGQEQSRLAGLDRDRAVFENSAQNQNFQQLMSRAGFGNQARQQMHQNDVGATQANNQNALQQFNAQNSARQSALQEAFAVRNQPINEITALMSGAQVQNPNFVNSNAAQLANTDVAGITMAAHNADMQNYQARMGAWNNIFGGLAGLGGSLIMASDRRIKTDVTKLGKTEDGLGIYKYRYKGSDQPQIGLMAQEVEKKKPDAVVEVNGLKMVNYDRALGGAA